MKRYLAILVIFVILGTTAFLLIKIYPSKIKTEKGETTNNNDASAISYNGGEWLGIYFQNKKIGYTFTKIGEIKNGYKFQSLMKMAMVVANELKEIKTVAQVNTDKDYRIKTYFVHMATFGHSVKTTGEIEGKKVRITLDTQGRIRTQELELDSTPYLQDALDGLIKKKELKTGDSLILPFFDILTQTPSKTKIKALGEEEITTDGEKFLAHKFLISALGMDSYLWLDKNWHFLKNSSPLGIDMVREDRQKALESIKPEELSDILTFVSVKLDTLVPDHLKVKYMKLQIEGLDTTDLDLNGDFQNIISYNPLIIEFISPDLKEITGIGTPGQAELPFVKPSMYIQSEDADIVNKAQMIAGRQKNKKLVVSQLTAWVFDNLKKRPTISMPSAIDVLQTMEGDCNEHSILFAALARALGIPTKIYVGLVNLGNAYYYHAWCSVYLGKWVTVDPTFGQFPADAGHLKLKEGELSEQTKVLKVVGHLKIKVLEYE